MAKQPDIGNLASGFRSANKLNTNFNEIKDAFDNTLSRDGSGPNEMNAPLDMNSQRILNLPAAVEDTDPVRRMDIDGLTDGVLTAAAEADEARDEAVAAAAIIVKNRLYPTGSGAGGNAAENLARYNQMVADGIKNISIPETINMPAFSLHNGLTLEGTRGAAILRDPTSTSPFFVRATGLSGFRIYGLDFDGQSPLTTTSHTLLSFDSGCFNFDLDGIGLINPERGIDGSWGGGITVVDNADAAQGTVFRIANIKATCPSDAPGSYAVSLLRTKQGTVSGLRLSDFLNGGLLVNDPTLPVPSTITSELLNIRDVIALDCGGAVTVYGSRRGVSGAGVDLLGQNYISARINISDVLSIRHGTYSLFVQAPGVHAMRIKSVDGTAPPEALMGGVLFDSDGGVLDGFETLNARGIALELGGSYRTTARNGSIRYTTVPGNIGANGGAAIRPTYDRIDIDGAETCILLSGLDGGDPNNWFPNIGHQATIRECEFTLRTATAKAVKAINGFAGVNIENNVVRIRDNGSLAAPYDTGSAFDVTFKGNRLIDETPTDVQLRRDYNLAPVVGTTLTIPDWIDSVRVPTAGPVTTTAVRYKTQEDFIGKIRCGTLVSGGSGYTTATAVTISGDGSGATAIPAISDGAVIGIYITNHGTGYTTATCAITDSGGGSGASIALQLGAGTFDRDTLVRFTGEVTLAGSNVFLNSTFTSSPFGISSLEILGRDGNILERGR